MRQLRVQNASWSFIADSSLCQVLMPPPQPCHECTHPQYRSTPRMCVLWMWHHPPSPHSPVGGDAPKSSLPSPTISQPWCCAPSRLLLWNCTLSCSEMLSSGTLDTLPYCNLRDPFLSDSCLLFFLSSWSFCIILPCSLSLSLCVFVIMFVCMLDSCCVCACVLRSVGRPPCSLASRNACSESCLAQHPLTPLSMWLRTPYASTMCGSVALCWPTPSLERSRPSNTHEEITPISEKSTRRMKLPSPTDTPCHHHSEATCGRIFLSFSPSLSLFECACVCGCVSLCVSHAMCVSECVCVCVCMCMCLRMCIFEV